MCVKTNQWTKVNLRFLSKQTEVVLHLIFVQDLPDEVTIGEDLSKVVWLCENGSTFNQMVNVVQFKILLVKVVQGGLVCVRVYICEILMS